MRLSKQFDLLLTPYSLGLIQLVGTNHQVDRLRFRFLVDLDGALPRYSWEGQPVVWSFEVQLPGSKDSALLYKSWDAQRGVSVCVCIY